MKKKLLLMVLCCLTIASLAACGNDTNTDTTVTDTPAPTEAVVDDTADNTDATVTESPVVTEPTAAPEETVTEAPVATEPTVAPTETPTPTEAPAPTEAPKELSKGEKRMAEFVNQFPFIGVEIFENVDTLDPKTKEHSTGCLIRYTHNGDEAKSDGFGGILKPGGRSYRYIWGDELSRISDIREYAYASEYGFYPYDEFIAQYYACEDELQVCEDANCLTLTYNGIVEPYTYYIIFQDADGKPVFYLYSNWEQIPATINDTQFHIDISSLGDIEYETAVIKYYIYKN